MSSPFVVPVRRSGLRSSLRAALRPAGVGLLGLALAGCGGGSSGTAADGTSGVGSTASGLAVGPGPQPQYRINAQPPAGSCHYGTSANGQPLPDRRCTPGAVSPAVTQADLQQTLCRRGGYTASIRPPKGVTDAEKRLNAKSYSYQGRYGDAEYDHLVPLGVGGDPNDPRNLWVQPPSPGHQPGSGPDNPKDEVESALHDAVCSGQVSLGAAQSAIATDWTTALRNLRVTPSPRR